MGRHRGLGRRRAGGRPDLQRDPDLHRQVVFLKLLHHPDLLQAQHHQDRRGCLERVTQREERRPPEGSGQAHRHVPEGEVLLLLLPLLTPVLPGRIWGNVLVVAKQSLSPNVDCQGAVEAAREFSGREVAHTGYRWQVLPPLLLHMQVPE